jgi:hypothetical protein
MLGASTPLRWHQDADGLAIQLPDHVQHEQDRPCRQAYAFKIEIGSQK